MKTKSFKIACDTKNKDLALLVDNQVNGWLEANPGAEILTITTSVDHSAGYLGSAFVTIVYKSDSKKK